MTTLAFPTGWVAVEQWATAVSQLAVIPTTSQVDRITSTAGELANALEEGVTSTTQLVSRLRSGPYHEAAQMLLQLRGTEKATQISPQIPQTLQQRLAAETNWLKGRSVMMGQEEQDPGAVYLLGAERLARDIVRFQANFPRGEEIKVILHAVGDAFLENHCPWEGGAEEGFRNRLSSLDDESLHYLRELAMVPPLHYLLVLDRLGLLPTDRVKKMPVGYEILKGQRPPPPPARETAVGNLVTSLRTLFGINSAMDLEVRTMGHRMDQIPAGVVRALSCLTCYPLGHLRVAERLGLIELPEILKP